MNIFLEDGRNLNSFKPKGAKRGKRMGRCTREGRLVAYVPGEHKAGIPDPGRASHSCHRGSGKRICMLVSF